MTDWLKLVGDIARPDPRDEQDELRHEFRSRPKPRCRICWGVGTHTYTCPENDR